MSEMGIAELLCCGSENIDLMRKKITQVLSMILGLVYPDCGRKNWQPEEDNVRGLVIEGPGCQWRIRAYRTEHQHYVMFVHCSFDGRNETMAFSSDGRFPPICMGDVQSVYESLDAFVEGMIITFPTVLVHGLKPFTQAAKKEL